MLTTIACAPSLHEAAHERRVRRLVADDAPDPPTPDREEDASVAGGEVVGDLAQVADERQLAAERDVLAERDEVLLGVDGEEPAVGPVGEVGVVEVAGGADGSGR